MGSSLQSFPLSSAFSNPHPFDRVESRYRPRDREVVVEHHDSRRWKAGLKVELLEFHGGVTPEEFLDLMVTVEETMDFKEVPDNRRVPLIATRFRGRAAAWWQQLKLTQSRQARNDIAEIDEQVISRTTTPTPAKPAVLPPPTAPPVGRATSGPGFKCFKYGEPGHRAVECRKGDRDGKALFLEYDEAKDYLVGSYEHDPIFDTELPEENVEEVVGDVGPMLVVRRACYAPREADAPVPDLKRLHGKAEDFVQQLQSSHKETKRHLRDSTAKYKFAADEKRRFVEFEVGDFVYAVLTKDRYSAHDYNKLATRKIGPGEITEKINPNAYRLKLPSHVRTADVLNVKHLIPFKGDSSSDEETNSRANFFLEEGGGGVG
ncbi:hypothetical protein RHSIM_Rhsim06G0081400 [Rhododendron simsii]|uniref:Tf2-1-like SH3-like domain-containing protein n=1 Tax=Rhododendron simsii TaxID=118357 RepID=A0A834LHX0_RHOSS|nr:hypothetical protein RHSIM_Rhsim06G0081400 [Rhododendron simsii]